MIGLVEAAILRGVAKVEAIWNTIAVECQIARAVVAQAERECW